MARIKNAEEIRERAKRDLFFLGKDILGYDLEEQPHREMCQFFVQKDPTKSVKEQSEIKERQMLLGRGCFKSTLNVIDSVQWIIGFPDIRILYLTNEQGLSSAFASQVKDTFTVRDEETYFQQLFPECCVSARKKMPDDEFTNQARTKFRKEPSFWANGILSKLPGWHCDVLKFDDIVNDTNTDNPEQIDKVIKRASMARKLRDPGGYIDTIGTPYDREDYYAYQRKHSRKGKFFFISHPAVVFKPEAKHKKLLELEESDVESYYFPKRLDWEYLKTELDAHPESFASQYLIDVSRAESGVIKFTDDMIDDATVPWETISPFSSYYAIWDLAYGAQQGAHNKPCLTAGLIVAREPSGRLALVELIADFYGPFEIANQVASVIPRYPLQYTAIEETLGVKWLEPSIRECAARLGYPDMAIQYIPVDRTDQAKQRRIALIPDALKEKKMVFSNLCIGDEKLREFMLLYTGKKRSMMDIPDVISLALVHLGNLVVPEAPKSDDREIMRAIKDKALRDILYPAMQVPVNYEEPLATDADVVNYFN